MSTAPVPAWRIATLMACHNRRSLTEAALLALRAQCPLPEQHGFRIELVLLDDASTDGTAGAVRTLWPEAVILAGSGQNFWCGGMRRAWRSALESDPDFFLLLNDDTMIEPDTVAELLAIVPDPETAAIAVAPIADPVSGAIAFGGHARHSNTPLQPNGQVQRCDTMNANCALIPRAVVRRIGIFHEAYTHAMGDFDYGFEAGRAGMPVLLAPHILGTSAPNPTTGTWRDTGLDRVQRLRLLLRDPKGLPFGEWVTYCRRNRGWQWPWRAVSPILRILAGR
jgi:GT2 family glycosyltransferase